MGVHGVMAAAASAGETVPLLPDFLSPERWLRWLGVLFILSVYSLATGVLGRLP